ncbi:zinc-ribbon domain-containing protein [Labrenzia sp. PHM005]|uniref:zinc-ribbon domain-containing protein n=1 Tax=Labrenzia sp. PHM005 TaxID=2590016 RepID=UPI0011405395|nr:zinc-ribbon domain-containing protein [Labrenzia sp. PHM005]QDG75300.1 thioredoxin [Labrenzia sp. PHM005]
MKITCPDCSTSYEIKPEALGAEGRSVKCAKCGNRWFVAPKQESDDTAAFEADAADEKPAKESAAADDPAKDEADWAADAANDGDDQDDAEIAGDESESLEEEPPVASTPPSSSQESSAEQAAFAAETAEDEAPTDPNAADIETLAKRPKIKVNPNKFRKNRIGALIDWVFRRNFRRIGGVALFGSAVALTALLVLMRDTLVKQSPDLASLYQMVGMEVNLRGLEFRNLRTFMEVEDGKRVLVVEGSIRNLQEETNSVPAVRLSIRSADLQEVYAWTVEPRTQKLNGLDETRFRTILADPPTGASDIQVRFVDRGQRNIVLE